MTEAMRGLLSDLHAAQRALKASSDAFDEALAGLQNVIDGIGQANEAQGRAMEAVIVATEKALALVGGPEH